MFVTAGTPWKNGNHLVALDESRDLTVCGSAIVVTSARRYEAVLPEWLSCLHCRAYAAAVLEDAKP